MADILRKWTDRQQTQITNNFWMLFDKERHFVNQLIDHIASGDAQKKSEREKGNPKMEEIFEHIKWSMLERGGE
tara:strand:- start:362 stop:583 length:222 start_codon:yes stop_codon:yes gene_type:complete